LNVSGQRTILRREPKTVIEVIIDALPDGTSCVRAAGKNSAGIRA